MKTEFVLLLTALIPGIQQGKASKIRSALQEPKFCRLPVHVCLTLLCWQSRGNA